MCSGGEVRVCSAGEQVCSEGAIKGRKPCIALL